MNTDNLRSQAVTIRDESLASANTASRVGTLFVDTITALDEVNQFKEQSEAYIKMLQGTIIGTLGTYDTWTSAITALDAMRPTTHASGRYTITIGGVLYPLTYIAAAAAATGWQMIEGGIIIKSDGTLATDTTRYCTFCSRYYQNSQWSAWQASAKKSDIPTPQSGTNGTSTNYVYSVVNNGSREVLSGTFKVYQYNSKIRICHKLWGSTTDYTDGMFHSADFPTATTGADGAMPKEYVTRINNTTLTESNTTTTQVGINYPNYATGGVKTLYLTAATSAKAGVMTAAQYSQLKALSEANLNDRVTNLESTEANVRLQKIEKHYKYLGQFDSEDAALAKLTDISVCADTELLHAHLTYDDGTHTQSSIILIQSIHGNYCRQIIFNKDKIFHRGITFTNLNRQAISVKEDWGYLLADRLQWSTSSHKYILSQFGQGFNHTITDPIPLATTSAAGLMSQEDKAFLDTLRSKS